MSNRERWAIVYRGVRKGYSPTIDTWYWTGSSWSSVPDAAKQYKRAPYSLPDPRQQDLRILLDTEYGRPEFHNARWYGGGERVAKMEVIQVENKNTKPDQVEVPLTDWRGMLSLGISSSRASLVARAAELAEESGDSITGKELGNLIRTLAYVAAPYSALSRAISSLEESIEETRQEGYEAAERYSQLGEEPDLQKALLLHHRVAGMDALRKALTEKLQATPENEL